MGPKLIIRMFGRGQKSASPIAEGLLFKHANGAVTKIERMNMINEQTASNKSAMGIELHPSVRSRSPEALSFVKPDGAE
jgi:hypothetical protein